MSLLNPEERESEYLRHRAIRSRAALEKVRPAWDHVTRTIYGERRDSLSLPDEERDYCYKIVVKMLKNDADVIAVRDMGISTAYHVFGPIMADDLFYKKG